VKICPLCSTEYGNDVKFCKNDGSALRALAPAADLVGLVIAERYHVIKRLGEGGMGQVYLAEHVKMGRRSAIKVMSPAMVYDPDAIARFNREAANASRITHPNVCAIYDFGETPDGLIYLAMEFIDGEPLTALLERETALPVERASRIFLQTADALQAAHDLGIVHRDLKPDNVMIARGRGSGVGDVVKVVDFGIAKAVGGDESQKVTKTGLVIGTPEFMSPEQLAGDKVDGRSDLYSLALVFFRMLTGKLPFAADTAQDLMIKRLTEEPLTLAQAGPNLRFPPGLQTCLDSAFARTPVERYQSVAKFAADVAGVVGLSAADSPARVPRTRPDADSQTQLLESAGTPRSSRRRSPVPLVIAAVALVGGAGAGVVLFGGQGTGSASSPAGDTTLGNPTGDTGGASGPRRGGPGGGRSTPPETRGPAVNVARARDLLDTLFLVGLRPATAGLVRDSATHIYNAAGLSRDDSAYAAFVIGQAHINLRRPDGRLDRKTGCDWIRRANALDPTNGSYARVLQQCGSP
jgi:eukaryotic-like serine/threonine-protein kinase